MTQEGYQEHCMQLALTHAEQAYKSGEVPVGSVIYSHTEQRVIAAGCNLVETAKNCIQHAEIVVIGTACSYKKSKFLEDCDLFVTLEPCMMCAVAISYAKIKRLFYIAPNHKFGAVEGGDRYFTTPACNHRPEIYPLSESEQYNALLRGFFTNLRQD